MHSGMDTANILCMHTIIMSDPMFSRVDFRQSPARWWFLIGVLALGVAGVLATALVAARSPGIKDDPFFQHLFQIVLVIHVDLSVLVWFLAFSCMVMSLTVAGSSVRQILPYLDSAARGSFILGILLMTGSAFDGNADALKSNYIPMLTSPLFFFSLALFGAGVLLMVAQTGFAWALRKRPSHRLIREAQYFHHLLPETSIALCIILLLAAVQFAASAERLTLLENMSYADDAETYYDTLYWAGGHILQFAFTGLACLSWCWLARSQGVYVSKALYRVALLALVLPVVASLYGVFAYPADHALHKYFYTQLMIMGNGLAPMIVLVGLGMALAAHRSRWVWRDARSLSLVCSLFLFFSGGLIGLMITGENVRIPAHYHGSIVGVTVGLMGMAVALLPRFGYRPMQFTRVARWQPIVLTVGQLMHVGGLAWSGGYGVLRKTIGGLDALPWHVKAAMGVMGTGGLIAIIGGLLFIITVWRSTRGRIRMV